MGNKILRRVLTISTLMMAVSLSPALGLGTTIPVTVNVNEDGTASATILLKTFPLTCTPVSGSVPDCQIPTLLAPFLPAVDLVAMESDGTISDVLRVNAIPGEFQFFSDCKSGSCDGASDAGIPLPLQTLKFFVTESKSTGVATFSQTVPTPIGSIALTVNINSDTDVPEPGTLSLVGIGGLALLKRLRRKLQ